MLTKAEALALAAMPAVGLVAAGRKAPFNGRVMWRLHEKGYVETPDRLAVPTLYRRTSLICRSMTPARLNQMEQAA